MNNRIIALNFLVHPARFERATPGFEVQCSIQLSYGCIFERKMDTMFGG